jgi:glutaredoxin
MPCGRRDRQIVRLTIYSKPGCHLCDVMKEVIHRVIGTARLEVSLDEIDITTDADLLDRYGTEIPVLMIDGTRVAKYRVTEDELRRAMQGRSEG